MRLEKNAFINDNDFYNKKTVAQAVLKGKVVVNPYLKQYQKNQVETASPEQILIMLYEGAIQFLNKAKLAFNENDAEAIHNNLIGAQKIIVEFMSTLDMDIGGEMAKNLYSLYEYLNGRLIKANIDKREDYVDEVLTHLRELRDVWKQAILASKKEAAKNIEDDEEDLEYTESK